MKLLKLTFLAWCRGCVRPVVTISLPMSQPPKPGTADVEKTMAKLSQLSRRYLGQHRSQSSSSRFATSGHSARRRFAGLASSDKGGPHETPIEAILGPDPVNKTVYYLDCHGGDSVFKGTVKLDGEDLDLRIRDDHR